MYKLKFKKLSRLLKNNTLIAKSISDNIHMLENIEVFLKKQLPHELQNHCYANNLANKCLILMVDSPAWSSKLRFIQPSLEQALVQQYPEIINALKIKVRPATRPENTQPDKDKSFRPALSDTSRSIIQDMAEGMDDSDLKESLIRLAKTKRK